MCLNIGCNEEASIDGEMNVAIGKTSEYEKIVLTFSKLF